MIAYDLKCQNNHTFEGWFEDAGAFKKQLKAGLIGCPVCNDTQITRIPSTFAIKGSPAPNPTVTPQINQKAMARAIAHYVDQNFDNVGADFASEALKIHYGVNAPRNIRGVSTPQEEETLRKEGVAYVKFPVPAENTSPDPETGSEN
jgi:hypothetical protein